MGFLDSLKLNNMIAPAGYAPVDQMRAPPILSGPPGGLSQGPVVPTMPPSEVAPAGPPAGLLAPPPGVPDDGVDHSAAPPQGLLARLTATDPNGITFRDKLMALGSILQGDSAGGQAYLEKQKANVLEAQKLDRERAAKRRAAAAFAGAFDPDGTWNGQKYAQAMGEDFDPKAMAELEGQFAPKMQFLTPGGGGVVSADPRRGTVKEVVAAPPPKAAPFMKYASGVEVPDEDEISAYVRAHGGVADATARAKQEHPAPRAPGRGTVPKIDPGLAALAGRLGIRYGPKGG